MEFQIATLNISTFNQTVKDICKKFKVEYQISYSEKFVLYRREDESGNKHDILGITATVIIPEIEKLSNTGFTYLGCIKQEEILSVHPTSFAETKGVSLSSLKAEIETFPCHECGKKIVRHIIHVFEENATGKITVYGSGCAVKKFGVDLSRLVEKLAYLQEMVNANEFDRIGGRGVIPFYVEKWAKIAFYNVAKYGYVTGKKAYNEGGRATSQSINDDYVILNMHPMDMSKYDKERKDELVANIPSYPVDVDAMVEWANSYVATLEENDFSFNIKSVVDLMNDGYISPRFSGFATYVVFKYWNDNIKPKEEKNIYNTDYTDIEVGQKIKNFEVEIVGLYTYESYYGIQHIYTLRGQDDRKYKWFSGKELSNTNGKYKISSATVKSLENDPKYGKAVVITRARMKEV